MSDDPLGTGSERFDYRPEDRPGNHVSVFPWPGGKGRESDWIIDKMPPHTCYVEVFGGSGALLYNKPRSRTEVYNDINDDLVQFFEVVRDREGDLTYWLRGVPYSRTLYEEWVGEYLEGVRPDDPIERAGRFYTLRFMSFAGREHVKSGFKTRNRQSPATTFDNARERLREVANRFRRVIIENKDFRDVLADYDGEHVLFYLDPPYVGTESYYGRDFDHAALVDALADVDGDWMVSYADLPDGLEKYHVLERTRRHRMCRGNDAEVTERLVCNFDPDNRSRFVRVGMSQAKLPATDGGTSVLSTTDSERQEGCR